MAPVRRFPRPKIFATLVAAALVAVALGAAGAVAARALAADDERRAVLDDAADRLGVEPSELEDALLEALKARVDAAVDEGRLTEEQDGAEEPIDSARCPSSRRSRSMVPGASATSVTSVYFAASRRRPTTSASTRASCASGLRGRGHARGDREGRGQDRRRPRPRARRRRRGAARRGRVRGQAHAGAGGQLAEDLDERVTVSSTGAREAGLRLPPPLRRSRAPVRAPRVTLADFSSNHSIEGSSLVRVGYLDRGIAPPVRVITRRTGERGRGAARPPLAAGAR